MIRHLPISLLGALLVTSLSVAQAQPPGQDPGAGATRPVATARPVLGAPEPASEATTDQRLEALLQDVKTLQKEQKDAQNAPLTDTQKKQLDLLQKQIETQQKMIELLAEQMKKQAPPVTPLDRLQAQTATLEARSQRAAQRDLEITRAIDTIGEHQDALERYGVQIPAQLKELFLPSGNNETPLSIYGTLAFGYSKIERQPGGFYFGEFSPDFLLKLNDWIFLEAEISVGSDGSVSAGSFAQADFFVNDCLTIVAGRFVAPIGWYNLRINNPWINKLPGDAPAVDGPR